MRPTKSTFALFAAILLALLALALAPAREGAKLLINDLFSLSESANAYVYDRLPVAAGASRLPACALLGGALAFLSACRRAEPKPPARAAGARRAGAGLRRISGRASRRPPSSCCSLCWG